MGVEPGTVVRPEVLLDIYIQLWSILPPAERLLLDILFDAAGFERPEKATDTCREGDMQVDEDTGESGSPQSTVGSPVEKTVIADGIPLHVMRLHYGLCNRPAPFGRQEFYEDPARPGMVFPVRGRNSNRKPDSEDVQS